MAHHFYLKQYAGVAELADALDLGSSVSRRGGSSPFTRTIFNCKLYILTYNFFYAGVVQW
jgi:hypothetical protein